MCAASLFFSLKSESLLETGWENGAFLVVMLCVGWCDYGILIFSLDGEEYGDTTYEVGDTAAFILYCRIACMHT